MDQACAPGEEGGVLELRIGEQTLEARVETVDRQLGIVQVDECRDDHRDRVARSPSAQGQVRVGERTRRPPIDRIHSPQRD